MGSLLLIAVAGFRGFSWMIVLALCFRPSKRALNSFSCSFSSCTVKKMIKNNDEDTMLHFVGKQKIFNEVDFTAASCSRSSSRVTVMERSHVYFLFIVSCIFLTFSSASFTSEKNYTKIKKEHFLFEKQMLVSWQNVSDK